MPPNKKPTKQDLQCKIDELEIRLAEAEETLRAIREGEVDAVIVSGSKGEQIFSLVGTDSIYRLIVETMKEAAFTVTFDGTVLFCNAQFGQFVKLPLEQVVGRPLQEFVVKDNHAAASSLLTAAQKQTVKQRLVFQATDGTTIPAHISANVLNQPDGLSICVVASDLSELENSTEIIQQLHRQQEALRMSEARYKSYLEVTGQIGWTTLGDGLVDDIPEWRKYTGQSKEEVKGWGWLNAMHPEDRERTTEVWNKAVAEKSTYETEYRIRRNDGVYRCFIARGIPSLREDGTICEWVGTCIDITVRKEAEEALKKSEERMRLFFDRQLVGMAITSPEKGWLEVNGRLCEMLGYSREELARLTWAELTYPEDLAADLAQFNRLLAGEINDYSLEKRFLRKDGKLVHTNLGVACVRRPDGSVDYVLALLEDITERKEAEMKLRQMAYEFETIIDSIPALIFYKDDKNNHIRVNKYVAAAHNSDKKSLEGSNCYDLYPAEEARRYHEDDLSVIRSGQPKLFFEEPWDTPKGRRWVSTSKIPFLDMDGKPIGVIGVSIDITERKKMEEVLRVSEERFRAIFDNSPDAYLIMELDGGRISACNMAAEAMLRGDRSRILGKTPDKVSPVRQPDGRLSSEAAADRIRESLRNGKHSFEWMHQRLDGENFWAHVTISVLTIEGRQVLLVAWRDITERKTLEASLQTAKAEAEAADKAKSEFLANMSHEIRTPLNAILGFSEVLADHIADSKLQGYLSSIQGSGKTLLTLINDILDLSKIEAGKMELQHVPVNPKALGCEIVSIFTPKCAQSGVDLALEISPELPAALLLDEVRLRQVLFNIVGNAVKFTPHGTVTLGMAGRHTVTSENESSIEFIIFVRDTGIGIPGDQLDVIFKPFQQQRGQLHAQYGGTGLGLTISRRLVEKMGGRMDVTSEPGMGSEFRVILPDVEIAATAVPTKESPPGLGFAFRNRQLLIADDVPYNRAVLRAMLDVPGITVAEAADGAELLDVVAINRPDLILLDLRISPMDGYETARRLKASTDYRDIPIIAITASVQESAERSALAVGCDAFLRKPILRSQLLPLIARLLGDETATPPSPAAEPASPMMIRADSPQLLTVLRQEILPKCADLQSKIFVGRIKDLAARVAALADEHHDEALAAWTRKLTLSMEVFDTIGMKRTLDELRSLMPDPEDRAANAKGG